ncbi:putative serine esterase-domain-containing protein [Polychytrium aggregatum]|uniref:putative serine esterase-domain-containing protein n=1 Tax=Polychytrium aggregatum TaxID=110093 RepID=UPI0022FE6710|nr:putative serine esterase-domain-containing protein [Polychytrium aggregatum]KAI9205880.1 putative serine esterase-domain-containing protein [Polychytrium aggregatum]
MISEGDSASASVGSTLVLVTVNGHKAFHSDFDNFVDAIKSQFFGLEFGNSSARDKVFVLQSKANESFATMDGLPKLAHRLASEIHQWVRDSVLPKIDVPTDLYFSLVGHSLGGLIIRVALPHLFGLSTSSSVDTLSLIDLVQANPNVCSFNPTSYMSICTPHLGSRRTDGNGAWNYIFHSGIELTCNLLMGRTGKELLLLDNPSERTSSMSLQQWLPQLPQLSSSAIFTADGLDSEGTKQPIIRRLTALVSPSGVSPPSTVSQNESGASAEDSRARDEASYKGILKGFPTIPVGVYCTLC